MASGAWLTDPHRKRGFTRRVPADKSGVSPMGM